MERRPHLTEQQTHRVLDATSGVVHLVNDGLQFQRFFDRPSFDDYIGRFVPDPDALEYDDRLAFKAAMQFMREMFLPRLPELNDELWQPHFKESYLDLWDLFKQALVRERLLRKQDTPSQGRSSVGLIHPSSPEMLYGQPIAEIHHAMLATDEAIRHARFYEALPALYAVLDTHVDVQSAVLDRYDNVTRVNFNKSRHLRAQRDGNSYALVDIACLADFMHDLVPTLR